MTNRNINKSKKGRTNSYNKKNQNNNKVGSEVFITHDDIFKRSNGEMQRTNNFDNYITDFGYNDHNIIIDDEYDEDEEDEFNKPEESIYKEIFQHVYKKIMNKSFKILNKIRMLNTLNLIITAFFTVLLLTILIFYKKIILLSSDENTNEPSFMDQPIEHSPLHKIILPSFVNNTNDAFFDNVNDLFDPRLTPAMLLLYIQSHLLSTKSELETDFNIAFSWEDWVDLDSRLKYDDEYLVEWLSLHSPEFLDSIDDLRNLDCKTFAMLYSCEGNEDFFNQCKDISDPLPNFPYKFEIKGPTSAKIKEPGRLLYGANYVRTNMPPPEQIYLLDVFGDEGEGSLMVKVDPKKNADQVKIIRNKQILEEFINWEIKHTKKDLKTFLKNGWNIETLRKRTSNLLNKYGAEKIIYDTDHNKINKRETYLAIKNPKFDKKMKVDKWKFEDFAWDEESFLNDLSESSFNNELDNKLYKEIEKFENFRIRNGYHPKYLREADIYGLSLGAHYDWRFFSGTLVTNDFRQSIIHKLSRTWLRFCFENGIKTFVAYGSMLGWIRNGLTLPWDGDIDVIVTTESLNLLARNFNGTLIVDYSSKDGFQSAMTGYFIDINPAYYSRIKGDGNNVIDGRLIDISTGMYLDITALSWSKNYLKQVSINNKLKKLVDKDYEMNQYFALEGDDVYFDTLMNQLKALQEEKQLIHCKNDNVFTIDELSVMIPSYFEGVRAYFPREYEKIIRRLYLKSLNTVNEFYHGHIFDDKYRLWINLFDCPSYANEEGIPYANADFGTCNNTRVLDEFELTKDYTARHVSMIQEGDWLNYELEENTESKPLRIDEFFNIYAFRLGISEDELLSLYL